MAENVEYFIPPETGKASVLANDLTPLPANACDAFIHAYVPDGGLVWNPFCRTDAVARAAARQGRRALLSDVNPLIAFTTRASLNVVSLRQLERAQAALAAAPTAGATLEHHINSLYATTCSHCGKPEIVRAFSWSHEQGVLVEKEFFCPTCGQERRQAVDDADRALLRRIEPRGRAYWTLVDRLGASEGLLRSLSERLLGLYTPRALYAISTILEKLEMTVPDRAAREILMLALLDTMSQSIKLCCDDKGQRLRAGLQRLTGTGRMAAPLPDMFVESNVWTLFVAACDVQRKRLEQQAGDASWGRLAPGGPRSPDTPPDNDITSYAVRQGSALRVAAALAPGSVDLILSAPPVIDWGDMLPLSFLWTGWLLGRDQARLFSPDQLSRPHRNNDWPWFFGAMQKSLSALAATLTPAGKLIFCLHITRLGYLDAIVLASAAAGLVLENVAYQAEAGESLHRPPRLGALPGYCYLRFSRAADRPAGAFGAPEAMMDSARRETAAAVVELLQARGEPAAYIWLHLAMLRRLSQSGILSALAEPAGGVTGWDRLRQAQSAIEQTLSQECEFVSASPEQEGGPPAEDEADEGGGPAAAEQHGWWTLRDGSRVAQPLSERVESAVYAALRQTPTSGIRAIRGVVYAVFPGLLTPEPGLIEACLQSYASLTPPDHWQLRRFDLAGEHELAHSEMAALLVETGHRLGFKVWVGVQKPGEIARMLSPGERRTAVEDFMPAAGEQDALPDVLWYRDHRAAYLFEVSTTAAVSDLILNNRHRSADMTRFLVAPVERAALIHMRAQSPLLRRRLAEDGWLFLRFDVVRALARSDVLTEADLLENAGLKPTVDSEGLQLTLL